MGVWSGVEVMSLWGNSVWIPGEKRLKMQHIGSLKKNYINV